MSDGPPRGHHKVFLGMAAGVGKTYRMLQEGQAAREEGRDVVIGYLEPHGRAETLAQAEGLELIPRREVRYRGTVLTEMDLDAVLRRAPELCLIDELAHSNAPGTEHSKRYEDVETVLEAGIDVFSTVNVQHLESLSDEIADLTGTRVRETLPDRVLAEASEVMLLDLTPEALRDRLRAGKIYPAERVQTALSSFFTAANLTALREVSLRLLAEGIEAQRNPWGPIPAEPDLATPRGAERVLDGAAPSAIGERLLALVTPRPASQRIVRRAWRSAQRLGAELDVLWVAADEPDAEQSEQLTALRKLCSVLGAHLLIEYGDDVALVAQRVARERGTTYVLIGAPGHRSLLRRTRPLPERLLRLLPGVDLRIVTDRSRRTEEEGR